MASNEETKMGKANHTNVYCYVQEEGSSGDLYFHSFDEKANAEAGRRSASEGAYRTSPVFPVPRALADTEGFADAVYLVLQHVGRLDYPDDAQDDEDWKRPELIGHDEDSITVEEVD